MNTWLTDILSWYIYMYVHLPCNGMLQGHDPLIIEKKRREKTKREADELENCSTLLPIHKSPKHKENAAVASTNPLRRKRE